MSNKPRQIIAISSAVIIILMVLFPPTETIVYNTVTDSEEVFTGYRFIGALESYQQNNQMISLLNKNIKRSVSIYSIETTRLYVQLFSVIVVTAVFMWAFGNTQKHS